MTTSATVPNTGSQSAANPLKGLLAYGQSPWMDYIRRDLLTGGGLKKFIAEDGLRGQTSNPTIFEKAIITKHSILQLTAAMTQSCFTCELKRNACNVRAASVWKCPRMILFRFEIDYR